MNQTDDLKLLRLQEEKKYINTDFIEELARQQISELVHWANKEIFVPIGGELTFDITLGPPNAGVIIRSDRPVHPRMEFRLSLISEIYADAFTFPIVCRRIGLETNTLQNFNETEQFRDCHVRFNSPLPELNESSVAELFRPICETFVTLNLERRSGDDRQLQAGDVRCRFIMFELMLVWTFFHELGHIVQGHYRMHTKSPSLIGDCVFFELDDTIPTHDDHSGMDMVSAAMDRAVAPDLAAQARELMADAEATDQTLKYLVMRGRLNFSVWYLLLCSTGCMFQRFYKGYQESLELSHARHPHPAIRDTASNLLGINWLADYLVASKNVQNRVDAAMPLAYLSARASLMTGLFRAYRVEKRDSPDHLPSYMALILDSEEQQRSYIKALLPEIERQLPMVLEYHLIDMHSLEYWFEFMKAAANATEQGDSAGARSSLG
ncbi:MAG: hypothetical protein Q8K61_04225 [Gallionella sp.]|nr:hypothetical protein [Gallionella sp.]